jgi:hypothetical protein
MNCISLLSFKDGWMEGHEQKFRHTRWERLMLHTHTQLCLAQLLHAAAERLSDHQREAGLMHNYTRLQPIKKDRFANLRFFPSAVQPGAKSHSFRSFLKEQEFRPGVLAEWMKNN